jgi:hypothetical protein
MMHEDPTKTKRKQKRAASDKIPTGESTATEPAKTPYEFLTEEEAAEELRLPSKRQLQLLRRTGKGPIYRRHGSVPVYTLEELRAWSEKHRFENTTQESVRWSGR